MIIPMWVFSEGSNAGVFTNPDGAREHGRLLFVKCWSFHGCRCCLHASGFPFWCVPDTRHRLWGRADRDLIPPPLPSTCHGPEESYQTIPYLRLCHLYNGVVNSTFLRALSWGLGKTARMQRIKASRVVTVNTALLLGLALLHLAGRLNTSYCWLGVKPKRKMRKLGGRSSASIQKENRTQVWVGC